MDDQSFNLLTIVIALVSLVISVVSGTWTVFAWRRAGPVIRCSGRVSVLLPDNEEYATIQARNIGRADVQVSTVGFDTRPRRPWWKRLLRLDRNIQGGIVVPKPDSPLASYPRPLAAGHTESWYLPLAGMHREVGVDKVRPFVTLGTGKTVHGEALDITEDR